MEQVRVIVDLVNKLKEIFFEITSSPGINL